MEPTRDGAAIGTTASPPTGVQAVLDGEGEHEQEFPEADAERQVHDQPAGHGAKREQRRRQQRVWPVRSLRRSMRSVTAPSTAAAAISVQPQTGQCKVLPSVSETSRATRVAAAGMGHELVEHIELRHLFENLDKAGIALIAHEKIVQRHRPYPAAKAASALSCNREPIIVRVGRR
jgi:hypothetical protein